MRSFIEDAAIDRGASGDGKDESDGETPAEEPPECSANGGMLGRSSMGEVDGRLSIARNRGETSGLGGPIDLWVGSSALSISTGLRGLLVNGLSAV